MLDRPRDPNGYYAALGLAPDADAAAVKAAFRRLAKRTHPDVGPPPGGDGFQAVSEAYRVLRDPLRRLCYDAYGEALPGGDTPRPHPCRGCGRISAQPRFVVLRVVRSYLVVSRRASVAGIFCPACAQRAALKASLATWLHGWWGPLGPVLTPWALMVNLLGGSKPRQQNFNLLLHQARAFAALNKPDMAHALAGQAEAYAAGPRDVDLLAEVAQGPAGGPRLRSRWHTFNAATAAQLVPLACLLAGILTLAMQAWPVDVGDLLLRVRLERFSGGWN